MMPLPPDDTELLSDDWTEIYNEYRLHDAWYSGDPNRLARVYSEAVYSPTPGGMFWSRQVKEERRTMLHVPVAGDIAGYSADLLFSEKPIIKIAEANEKNAAPGATKAQERLEKIIEEGHVMSRLHEAAETCAALGGVVLKPAWDRQLADYPILSVAQADNALPEFRHGILSGLTLWKVIEDDGKDVWRLVERYEPNGQILTGLYRGTVTSLGKAYPLTSRSDTAGITGIISTGIRGPACRYIANMRPNRRHRGSYLGRSDFAGAEQLMDALDEVYSSWMRDVRLAKGRIIVPEGMLDFDKSKGDFYFDADREAFTQIDVPVTPDTKLTVSQFAIRTEEHAKTALNLLERIISHPGYSPQSFGLQIEGRADSGTSLNVRERRSFTTGSKKQEYWKSSIADVLHMMMIIDKQFLNSGVVPLRPSVAMQDSIKTDPMQVAQSIEILRRAKVVSIETGVRMANPDWSDEQVAHEVKRIRDEDTYLPDPIQTGIA